MRDLDTKTRYSAEAPPVAEPVGLLKELAGDGRPLLMLVALGLILSGLFALFLSATGSFLPHDVAYLGMQPQELCALHACRVVHFIFHDRVSFGGTLMAIGTLYLWLIAFPLRDGEAWAWWTLLFSGSWGFLSFLAYLIYGYLDTWHAVASAGMLPLFVAGIWMTRRLLPVRREGLSSLLRPAVPLTFRTRAGFGRACLLFVGAGMAVAGAVITILGSTVVFVPQDMTYLGYTAAELNAINLHLIPLIAHDRAGFGGGLACCGLTVLAIVWKACPSRALWQALLVGGVTGFGCAIGVHYKMNYLIVSHIAPAWLGAVIYAVGIICLFPMSHGTADANSLWDGRKKATAAG
ncbi:hypothetical protein [Granulicella arctica]|uniref:hypothetical protein n=1 Tax=Granulicella arctica TaxID=940613 RepID=UPI0021E09B51|nr:hypothetical protein [Granulicella arctica]